MGDLMKGKFNIGFIDVDGWDTHVNRDTTPSDQTAPDDRPARS